jgi:SAM-dependent methyltransferase
MTRQHAPATHRNREPIREVLARVLPASGTVLEIASGTGEHAVYFARAFPALVWQPTDADPMALASIAAWREGEGTANLSPPLALDVHAEAWPAADAIVCCNMIHIAPWSAALALFAGAARVLAPGGALVLYGPYLIDGVTAPSNLAFDRSLRARDPAWGVREVRELEAAARGFVLEELAALPANNHVLVWRRTR